MILDAKIESQFQWDVLIRRHGERGLLRQPSGDRPVSVSVQQQSAVERMGAASNPLDRNAFVSPLDPDTGLELSPAPSEKDILVQFKEDGTEQLLKIVAPPEAHGSNIRPMYWRLKCRR